MSQLINSYPVFEGNQVLTSSQLNQMTAYLDEQNRLTRVKLIGSGVVCGLELNVELTANPPLIHISKGIGVTSEGYLMSTGNCTLNRYRSYTLPSGMTYLPFVDPNTRQQDVELFELLSIDQNVDGEPGISFLNVPTDFLSDKVVMLFYECVDDDSKSCLGKSCDDRGMNRVFTLRKLLVSISDLENKIIPRTCLPDKQNNVKYNLPRFIIGEPKFQPSTPQSTSYNEFSQNYVQQILNNTFKSDFLPPNTSLYDALFDALRQTYTDFAGVLAPIYGSNPFAGLPTVTWTSFLNQQSAGPMYLGVQYFYDFIKDLILAYNEFYDAAFALMSECCSDMDCFPMHLLLGEVIADTGGVPAKYRNYFTPSQAITGGNDALDRLVMLHKRMVLMTKKFNLNIINNPSITPVPPGTLGQPVLITPSNEKRDPLSMRSIPYYYFISEEEAGLGTLEENWSYKFIKECLFNHGLKPLAYGNQSIVQTSNQGPVETPLYYDMDPYNFLRIEGAIRQHYLDVEDELDSLRSRFNLPFNFLTVRLSGEPFDDIRERCNFDDIRTQYLLIRERIKEMSMNLFNQVAVFNRVVQLKPFPGFLTSLTAQSNSGSDEKGSVTQPQVGWTTPRTVGQSVPLNQVQAKAEEEEENPSPQPQQLAALPLRPIPVFATRRNMAEAVAYFQSNLLELAQSLYELFGQMLPFDFNEFDFGYTGTTPNQEDGFIQTYNNAKQYAINVTVAQNQILDLITRSKSLANTPGLYASFVSYFDAYKAPLGAFISNNDYKALTTLYYLYEYRIGYLKQNDITLFSNFIKKHPGATHQAGVPKGGTYIMVVPGNPVQISQPTRQYAVAVNQQIKALQVGLAKAKFQPAKSFAQQQQVKNMQAQILALSNIQLSLAGNVPVAFRPAPNLLDGDQVIADFTLPYLISCDCSCDEIPAPTSESSINMPALSSPYIAVYDPGDYAYAKGVMKSTGSALMFIDVSDALQFDRNQYTDSNIKLYLVNKNGARVAYNFVIPPAGQSMQQSLMPTYNYPNNPANTQQYGTAGIAYQNGKWFLTYVPVNGFAGIDSFSYTFELINPSSQAVLQNGTTSVVTVNVGA
jgi:hypothetical protein